LTHKVWQAKKISSREKMFGRPKKIFSYPKKVRQAKNFSPREKEKFGPPKKVWPAEKSLASRKSYDRTKIFWPP
jgi:hypothetical protein